MLARTQQQKPLSITPTVGRLRPRRWREPSICTMAAAHVKICAHPYLGFRGVRSRCARMTLRRILRDLDKRCYVRSPLLDGPSYWRLEFPQTPDGGK
jgi:hypothetical protein